MNRRVLSALLGALSVCAAAVSVAAPPQYAVVDLGVDSVPGTGLLVIRQSIQSPRQDLPSSGGTNCQFGNVVNHVYVEFDSVAIGDTCAAPIGQHAAKWTFAGGQWNLTDLGTLPGSHPDIWGDYSVATDYNTAGDIVGTSQSTYSTLNIGYPYVADHGFIYNNGQWTDLIPIAGPYYFSSASGVNASREVVGSTNTISSVTGETLNRAFIYIDGKMYNLTFYLVGGPTVLLTNATGIDCQGNIGATGTPAGSVIEHHYLLIRQGPARTSCPK